MRLLSLVFAVSAFALPVHAQTVWTDSQWQTGAWQLIQSEPKEQMANCYMAGEYEVPGHSNQTVGLALTENDAYLLISSNSWTVESGTNYNDFGMTFYPSLEGFDGPAFGTSGNGISMMADHSLADRIASNRRLVVTRGEAEDKVVVADLPLEGTAQAVAALRRCLMATVARNNDIRERENRNKHIATNPFAPQK